MIKFTIHQTPSGKQSPRFASRGGISLKYKSKEQRFNEDMLATEMVKHRPDKPMTGAIKLYVRAYLKIPASKPKWWKKAAIEGIIAPTVKPDYDNILKQIGDVMTRLQFWNDDRQIVEGFIQKKYAVTASLKIEIEERKQPQKICELGG